MTLPQLSDMSRRFELAGRADVRAGQLASWSRYVLRVRLSPGTEMSRWVDLAAGANISGGLTWLPEPIRLDGSTWPLKPIHLDSLTWPPESMSEWLDLTAGADTSGWLNLGTGTDVWMA